MIPDKAIELVKRFEGLHKLRSDGLVWPYFCPAGVPTIGWGTVVSSINHLPITPEEALERLMVELEACYRAALRMSPVLLDHPARLSAIISFIYNLGSGNYRASTLKKRVDAQDWIGAGREIRRWVFGGGRKLPGLVLRREAEARLLEQ
jgi:lysozyme